MGDGKIAVWIKDGNLKTQMELQKVTTAELGMMVTNLEIVKQKLLIEFGKRGKSAGRL